MLEQYLERVRTVLDGFDLEVEPVIEDVRAHVLEALAEGPHPAGTAAVLDTLRRLGEPESWIRDRERPGGQRDASSTDRAQIWQSIGVFTLTVLGIAAFPWVGPLILLFAWIAARAVLAAERQALPPKLRWLLYPAIVLFVGFVAAAIALLPALPMSEIASESSFGSPALLTIAGLLCWWALLWLATKKARPVITWFARPLLDR